MNRTVRISGGLSAWLALLLAGCASGLNTDGPFGNSNGPGAGGECTWTTRGGVATIGLASFPNSGGPARIEKVTLVDPHNLRLVAAWVVPITGHNLLGVFDGYPPVGTEGLKPAPGVQWAHRQRAEGALVQHTPGQHVLNLVLVLRASGVKGAAKSVYVDYQSGGTRYRLVWKYFIELFNGNRHGCQISGA